MKHHILMQLSLGLILSLFIQHGYCKGKFSSFQEIDLEYDDDIGRSDDFVGDDDIKLSDQDYSENTVDAKYKYSFNVIDEEEQVYQSQKQERDKGVGLRISQTLKLTHIILRKYEKRLFSSIYKNDICFLYLGCKWRILMDRCCWYTSRDGLSC